MKKISLPKPPQLEVNGIEIGEFKYHPRVMELRIALLHSRLIKEYGADRAIRIFATIADILGCNSKVILAVLNQWVHVRRLQKTNRIRFKQEAILLGALWGESRTFVWTNLLMQSRGTMYNEGNIYKLECFIDEEWLDELDNEVKLAGNNSIREELARFLIAYETFREVLGNVSISKTRV